MSDPAPKRRWFRWSLLTLFVAVAIYGAVELVRISGYLNSASSVRQQLQSAASSGSESFDFDSGAPFAWDRMFVFDCYSTREDVENALGFAWPAFYRTSIESSDSVCLVVFIQNSTVVDWFEQPRDIELGSLASPKGYARSEARFKLVRADDRWMLEPLETKRGETKRGHH